jgi:predicted dehydrogenase
MPEAMQAWPRPAAPRPIVIIGAGGIVRTAHLPAYQRLALPVAGVYDVDPGAARTTAERFGVPAFATLPEALDVPGAVFDLAVPGDQIVPVLERLPEGAPVLIQKPMGKDLADARRIRAVSQARRLTAAVNFQLRFSPGMLAIASLLRDGEIGPLVDIDVYLMIRQPWELWTFMEQSPRLEVLYHSIHYLDAIRGLAGEPAGVYCRGVRHPSMPKLQDTRSTIILDYGDALRCSLVLNHTHGAGMRHRASTFTVEGLTGTARLTMGVNLDYPNGPADTLEVARGSDWRTVPLRGSWFTEAFEGPMSNLQRFVAGEDDRLVGSVEDAIGTMAVVEACYQSSAAGGTPVPAWQDGR